MGSYLAGPDSSIPEGALGRDGREKYSVLLHSHYGRGVDSASNRNEYQENFLGVNAAGA